MTVLRRVLASGGTCVAVTNGAQHLRSLRELIERAVWASTPGWRMRGPTGGVFTAENGAPQLGVAFHEVTCVRPAQVSPVVIEDAAVAADYVNSLASHYQDQVAPPWREVASDVQEQVQAVIDTNDTFRTVGDVAAFVCR